jgi:RNA polymerase sigma-70 factor (ECF subfamily)
VNGADTLLQRIRASPRDEKLWAALYEEIYPQVHSLTIHLCGMDRELARDITQDAFLRFVAAGAIRRVESSAAAVAYLRAIVRNLVRDHYRKRMQHPTISTSNVEPVELEHALERIIERTITNVDLLALRGLGDDDRELLRLALEGRTIDEIATHLGLSYSAAGVRLHRLRKHLRVERKENTSGRF